jgi:hypothetical protein
VAALHSFQFWVEPHPRLLQIQDLLRPGGCLLLILRSHERRAPAWLPNPISRRGGEIEGTRQALRAAGFTEVAQHAPVGSSAVLVGYRSL